MFGLGLMSEVRNEVYFSEVYELACVSPGSKHHLYYIRSRGEHMILGGKHIYTELKGLLLFSNKTHKSTLATMKIQVLGTVLPARIKVLQVTNTTY